MSLWLTRIIPNPRSPEVRRDLAGRNTAMNLHRRLMSLYPSDAGPDPRAHFGVLFRIDDTHTGPHILLQSTHQPDLTRLPEGYGTHQSRPLDTLLNALKPGLSIRYRCAASPVRKPGATTRALYNLPAVVPLTGAHADEWWTRQADLAGIKALTLHSHPLDAAQATRQPDHSGSPQRIHHARTRFDGSATITDPDLLRQKITEGIGRGKAYGCGLLTIAPARTTT
ncbi:type I-E CRISPR-associated protein Cas6/Cse3/CasE [Streptomyces noursei]|uniref:type I-E CRISPR-associated protein Cas6/Cse3/CasE n=1 Tax=Streptomyces noursei TaxID=1971 RepID=UPI0005CB2519|nr:type I-E CRISPR-associated protein Cas6/Cse3/CasE [Streptomyces noursei]